jgi:vancomycin resistance protein YoaR
MVKHKNPLLSSKVIKMGRLLILTTVIVVLFIFSFVFVFNYLYKDKIYPNIFIAEVNVGGLTKNEAQETLRQKTVGVENITLTADGREFKVPLENISFAYDLDKSINYAYSKYRTGSSPISFVKTVDSLNHEVYLKIDSNLNKNSLKELLFITLSDLPVEPTYPSLSFTSEGINVINGTPGKVVNFDDLTDSLFDHISRGQYDKITVPIEDENPVLSVAEINDYKRKGEAYLNKKIIVNGPLFFKTELTHSDILKLLSPTDFYEAELDRVVLNLKSKVDKNPENSVFKEENGKVLEFKVSRNGISVDTEKFKNEIKKALVELSTGNAGNVQIEIPYEETLPEITTEKVNNLGIKELLGTGYSEFTHSIPSRVHNVGLAASKFNGVLISPGETFSFNKVLGDVSKYTGYQQAYVIRDGRTILGDGGGVCQVSTTLFRALLNSGLPITERQAHSYRVSYYEQGSPAGLDATVYSPSPDLKFVNDTPGSLLIQTIFNGQSKNLIFEIYGTNDGRKAEISTPKIISQIRPPEDIYIDDPSLPAGKIIQEEHKAWGAKVVFNYTVERNGKFIINKDFTSNYRPWAAVYRRGTGPQI